MVRKASIAMLLSCYSESTPMDAVESHVLPLMTKTFFHFCVIASTQLWKNEPSWSAAFLLHHPHCQLSSVCRGLIRKGSGRNEQIAFFRFQMEFVNLTGEEEK